MNLPDFVLGLLTGVALSAGAGALVWWVQRVQASGSANDDDLI